MTVNQACHRCTKGVPLYAHYKVRTRLPGTYTHTHTQDYTEYYEGQDSTRRREGAFPPKPCSAQLLRTFCAELCQCAYK